MLSDYYNEQIRLAGDNQKAKEQIQQRERKETDKLRRQQAQKEKRAAIFSIIINTAAGVAKAFATSATVYDAYINAALVAIKGAAELAS